MADCVAQETQKLEGEAVEEKCPKEVEAAPCETKKCTTECTEKTEEKPVDAEETPETKSDEVQEEQSPSRKRKPEDAEPVEDGVDEAKKVKPADETNGACEPNGKETETEEQPPEVTQKTVEDIQRLTAEAEETAA